MDGFIESECGFTVNLNVNLPDWICPKNIVHIFCTVGWLELNGAFNTVVVILCL